ncbi:uncharacterized protein LOC119377716 [Rhipicephalus sanguineus]|uniref:uncharacterized protein LOC119377716 n=1 Tax=Rhipicephalus sanguineus TaxID=34632 RepID=UPI001893917C|nr:uncharacterized protein LOC119377716 [Rhipicephalus sanguineus]
MASRPNAEAQPTAAGEQPADDSMLLSPSSSPVRRSSAVTSPSFDVDEIGLFIRSRLNCSGVDVDAVGAQQRNKNEEYLLPTQHKVEAASSTVHPDGKGDVNATPAEALPTPKVPRVASTTGHTDDSAPRNSAVSSTERRGSSSHGIEVEASKPTSGSKTSFFGGFTWSLSQGNKQKKSDNHSPRSASPQANREGRVNCSGKADAMEGVASDAARSTVSSDSAQRVQAVTRNWQTVAGVLRRLTPRWHRRLVRKEG